MDELKKLLFLGAGIVQAGLAFSKGKRPASHYLTFRNELSKNEVNARGLESEVVNEEVEFDGIWDEEKQDYVTHIHLLQRQTHNMPLDMFTAELVRLMQLCLKALFQSISAILTLAKSIFLVEENKAERLLAPQTINTLKLGVTITLSPRLIPTPILRAPSAH